MIIHSIRVGNYNSGCGIVPKQNQWAGVFMCDTPTKNEVTWTTDDGHYYVDYPICDNCIRNMQNESMDY